jgi:hypothetical protein
MLGCWSVERRQDNWGMRVRKYGVGKAHSVLDTGDTRFRFEPFLHWLGKDRGPTSVFALFGIL